MLRERVYHAFFVNFTRLGQPMPSYINLMREPTSRFVSQFEFWKT